MYATWLFPGPLLQGDCLGVHLRIFELVVANKSNRLCLALRVLWGARLPHAYALGKSQASGPKLSMTTAPRLTPRLSSTSPALTEPEQVTVENPLALLKVKGPSRGSGIELNSTYMRKCRAYSRRSTKLSRLGMIHAPRLYQALRDMLRLFPPWAMGQSQDRVGICQWRPTRPQGVVRPSTVAIRYVLELSILPPVVHTPGDSWASGTKNTCSITEAR